MDKYFNPPTRTMFDKITDKENLKVAHKNTIKGKAKHKLAAVIFNSNKTHNMENLRLDLITGNYTPSGYSKFYVTDPAVRLIHAPEYRDKIVQHGVNNILRDIYEKKFIFDSYACIRNKGNQRAVKRLRQFTINATTKYGGNAYLCKIDMRKFFYTINREILKKIISRTIDCIYTLGLIYKIIDNATLDVDGNINDLGLPLGNLTSQLFANIIMNEVDQYAKRILKCKYYLRYADDIFVFCSSKEHAVSIKASLSNYIESVVGLQVNDVKSHVCKLSHGFNGLGFNFKGSAIRLSQQNKKRIKRIIRKCQFDSLQFEAWANFASMGHTNNFITHMRNKLQSSIQNTNGGIICL